MPFYNLKGCHRVYAEDLFPGTIIFDSSDPAWARTGKTMLIISVDTTEKVAIGLITSKNGAQIIRSSWWLFFGGKTVIHCRPQTDEHTKH
jgi:hypothetical protein